MRINVIKSYLTLLLHTPLLMALAFLALTLMVGLYAAQKTTTFREYAVGNKRMETTSLILTILATTFGGGIMVRNMPNVYRFGIDYIVFFFSSMIMINYIISQLALRMGPFMGHISLAETIGSVYGKYPRAIAALLSTCFSIAEVAVQIKAISSIISICIDSIHPDIVSVLITLIFIAYAMAGGVDAITATDIVQFVTFITIIAFLARLLFIQTGKSFLEVVWLLSKEEKFQISRFFQFDSNLLQVMQRHLWFAFVLHPSIIQRVYMSSTPIQAYKAFLRVMLFSVMIAGCIVLISLFVFVENPKLSSTEVWRYILTNLSPVYKGYVVVCLLGMVMSTADSYVHTAAIMIGHDMVESMLGVKTATHLHRLRLVKGAILVLGLLAMILAVCYPDPFQLSSFVFNYFIAFFGATVTPLFILAVFGFRGSARTALIGMAIGAVVHLTWEKWVKPTTTIYAGIIPMAANALAMMAAHYLLRQPTGKGWIKSNDQQKRTQKLIRAFKKYKKSIELE